MTLKKESLIYNLQTSFPNNEPTDRNLELSQNHKPINHLLLQKAVERGVLVGDEPLQPWGELSWMKMSEAEEVKSKTTCYNPFFKLPTISCAMHHLLLPFYTPPPTQSSHYFTTFLLFTFIECCKRINK